MPEVKRLKSPEEENTRLKKLPALFCLTPFHPNHAGRSGNLQLSRLSETEAGQPVSRSPLIISSLENHANAGGSGFSAAVSGSMGKNTTHTSDSSGNDTSKSGQSQQSGDNSLPMGTLQQTKDRASSTTYSAISPGTIEIRNPDAQKQDVSQISRDTAAAENVLKDKFDVQKAEGSLAIQREMAVLGQQAIQQTFDALKKQEKEQERNKLKNDAAFNKLSEADQKKALDKIDQNVEEKYGIGSDLQIAAQAISGLFAGLAGGNVSGAVAAGAAPLLAQMVKQVSQGNEPMRVLLHTLASGLIAKAQGGSAIGGAAGGLTAGMLSYNDALSHLLYGKDASELSADDKMLIANIVTLAGAAAGGAVDGSAGVGSGASAGRTEVENNYLSSTEKSRQTYLNNKQNLTPEEQKDKERLNRKDLESDMAVYAACNGTGAGCQAERAKAKAAQDTYFNQTYQNPKEAQAGYQQIVNLLNSTDPNAKEVFNILEGYTQAFMSFGYTEDEAKARAGAYVGSMYIASGVSAVVASGALAKQFGKDVALNNKASASGAASSLVKNADGIYEVKINLTPLEGHDRLNTPDLLGNGKYNPAEAAAAARLETAIGKLDRITNSSTDKNADFIITSGPNAGKTVDLMYTTKNLSQKEIDGINKFYEKNMTTSKSPGDIPHGQDQILQHLKKADLVPVDFSVLTQKNQAIFMDFIKTLPKSQQDKIIIMR